MLILSTLLLLSSNAVVIRRDKSILYARIVIAILICCFLLCGFLLCLYSLYSGSIDKELSLFSGLYHTTAVAYIFYIFFLIIYFVFFLVVVLSSSLLVYYISKLCVKMDNRLTYTSIFKKPDTLVGSNSVNLQSSFIGGELILWLFNYLKTKVVNFISYPLDKIETELANLLIGALEDLYRGIINGNLDVVFDNYMISLQQFTIDKSKPLNILFSFSIFTFFMLLFSFDIYSYILYNSYEIVHLLLLELNFVFWGFSLSIYLLVKVYFSRHSFFIKHPQIHKLLVTLLVLIIIQSLVLVISLLLSITNHFINKIEEFFVRMRIADLLNPESNPKPTRPSGGGGGPEGNNGGPGGNNGGPGGNNGGPNVENGPSTQENRDKDKQDTDKNQQDMDIDEQDIDIDEQDIDIDKQKKKAENAKYYKENKDEIAKTQAKYREDNKDKIAKREAKYYKDNKDEMTKKNAKYYKDNKAKIAETRAKYREDNKDKIS